MSRMSATVPRASAAGRRRPLVHRRVVAGVDVGATWIRVAVLDGSGRAQVVTRPARDVPELSKVLLRALAGRTGRPCRLDALVVASRGVWTTAERQRIARRLRGIATRIDVLSDAQAAALGALGGRAGVLVLSGTGSIVLGRNARGRWARAGGLGPLLGDEGSGFWLGREWLRATTDGEDFMPARRLVQSPNPVARIAALAPAVIRRARRGDRRARAIVADAQRHLAAFTADVARRLALTQPIDVSWAGRVIGDAWFRRGVARALARTGVSGRWHAPVEAPVMAAARLAQTLATRDRGPARLRRAGSERWGSGGHVGAPSSR
ncbi:MAG: hypothetical protein HYU41_24060 [Candidatus Rokubacteria bacterium]|nr:hypothetical protein [Candidatus Rokubacteria bacterium]